MMRMSMSAELYKSAQRWRRLCGSLLIMRSNQTDHDEIVHGA
jgi:hypothetical protein